MARRVTFVVLVMICVGYTVDAGFAAIWGKWHGWTASIPHALGVGALAAFYLCSQNWYADYRRSGRRIG